MAGLESLNLCSGCVRRHRVHKDLAVRIHPAVQSLLREARAPSSLLRDLGGRPNPHALTWLALNWRVLVVGNRSVVALDARPLGLKPDDQLVKWLDRFLTAG